MRSLTSLACLSLSTVLLLFLAGPAQAQLPPQAQEAMESGVLAAQQQEYLLAIRFFQDARKIAPAAPVLLFNLGLAESKIPGRELRAMTWFGAYLEASPSAANVAAVKEQIKVLDVKTQGSLTRLIRGAEEAAKQFGDPLNFNRNFALGDVVELWADSGDVESAIRIANSIQHPWRKKGALMHIVNVQAADGDFAGALKTANIIYAAFPQDTDDKSAVQYSIASAQVEAGDIAGAQKTVDSMQVDSIFSGGSKSLVQEYIAKARAKNKPSTKTNTVPRVPLAPTADQWVLKNSELLNEVIFLDLATYLKSLPSDDARKIFDGLHDAVKKVAAARQVITQMLKQQAKR